MGLLELLCEGPPVADSSGNSCEGATLLSLLRLRLLPSLLWLGAGSCCLRGLILLSPLSSGCSSVCTLPGSAGQPSSLSSRGLLSELKASAFHLQASRRGTVQTSQQHPERWAVNPQCPAHHVWKVCGRLSRRNNATWE